MIRRGRLYQGDEERHNVQWLNAIRSHNPVSDGAATKHSSSKEKQDGDERNRDEIEVDVSWFVASMIWGDNSHRDERIVRRLDEEGRNGDTKGEDHGEICVESVSVAMVDDEGKAYWTGKTAPM